MRWLSDAFPVGCRVRLSPSGRRMVAPRSPTGIVVGYSRSGVALRVKRDGRKAVIATYHEHWERLLDNEPSVEEHW